MVPYWVLSICEKMLVASIFYKVCQFSVLFLIIQWYSTFIYMLFALYYQIYKLREPFNAFSHIKQLQVEKRLIKIFVKSFLIFLPFL